MRNPFGSPLWQNAAFVRVWTAATISIFGSLVTRIALPLAAILVLGAGAVEVAVLRSMELGATLLVGLVAGARVDRLRRRPVLIRADLGRAAMLGSIPVAFALGVLTFWQLLVVSGLAAASGLRDTAWLAPLGGVLAAAILWASPERSLLVLPDRAAVADRGRTAVASPLAEAAAAAIESERDQPVGG